MAKVPDEGDTESPTPASPVDDTMTMPAAGAAHGPQTPRSSPVTRLTTTEVYGDRYVIRRELARGGMGRVLLATDLHLDRDVAIKELIDESPHIVNRFEREVRLTAKLQHPSIVSIFDTGRTRVGKRYYVMRQIPGQPLSAALTTARSLDERLSLLRHVIAISEALAYAHQHRIIHRDLKSGNVLIGPFGETIVIDWGLAKAIDETADDPTAAAGRSATSSLDTQLTSAGSIMGTPAFMSPEQARGVVVDERSDVYSIGAILWQLLTGKPPYDGSSSDDILEQILRGPPALGDAPTGAPIDLVAIAKKACAYDPANRYNTAAELAVDLRSFEAGQLVAAHRYSSTELIGRWVRRNSRAVAVAVAALVALAAFGAVTIRRIVREQHVALQKEAEAQSARAETELRNSELILAQARSFLRTAPVRTLAWLKQYPTNAPHWAAARLLAAKALDLGVPTRVLRGHSDTVYSLKFSQDGRTIVSTSNDRTIRVWDTNTNQARIFRGHNTAIYDVALSPTGESMFSVGGDNKVMKWNLGDGSASVLNEQDDQIRFVSINSIGSHLLLRKNGKDTLHLIDIKSRQDQTLHPMQSAGPFVSATFSADGNRVFWLDRGAIYVRDLAAAAQPTAVRAISNARNFALSRDGLWLAVAKVDGSVVLRALGTGAERTLLPRVEGVATLKFLPDSKHVVVIGEAGTVGVVGIAKGEYRTLGHCDNCAVIPPTGDGHIFAIADEKQIIIWDLNKDERRVLLTGSHTDGFTARFSPKGDLLATASTDDMGTIHLWNVDVPKPKSCDSRSPLQGGELIDHDRTYVAWGKNSVHLLSRADSKCAAAGTLAGTVVGMVRSPDGNSAVTVSDDGTLRLWSSGKQQPRLIGVHAGGAIATVFSPDGRRLFSLGRDQSVLDWDLVSGKSTLVGRNLGATSKVAPIDDRLLPGADLATGGHSLVTRDASGVAWLWDLASGKPRKLRDGIARVAVSPDGKLVAMAAKRPEGVGSVATVPIYLDSIDGSHSRTLVGHTDAIHVLQFSSNGALLLSGGNDDTARLWDATTGAQKGTYPYDSTVTTAKLFGADHYLALSGTGLTARVYDVETRESQIFEVNDIVYSLSVAADGSSVVAPTAKGTILEWHNSVPLSPTAAHEWLMRSTDVQASASDPS